jgi:hypothetical protein
LNPRRPNPTTGPCFRLAYTKPRGRSARLRQDRQGAVQSGGGGAEPRGIVDDGNGGRWEWRTMGMADEGNGGRWEWRTMGMADDGITNRRAALPLRPRRVSRGSGGCALGGGRRRSPERSREEKSLTPTAPPRPPSTPCTGACRGAQGRPPRRRQGRLRLRRQGRRALAAGRAPLPQGNSMWWRGGWV